MKVKKPYPFLLIALLLGTLPCISYGQKPIKSNKTIIIPPTIAGPKTKTLGVNPDVRTRILFLLDASGSMSNSWNNKTTESKIESAKKVLIELADSLNQYENVEIALRVYGHQYLPTERNCTDSKLEAGFSRSSVDFIRNKLKTIHPKGVTPIAYSLEKCMGDFPSVDGRNVIILMTDGEESCNGDPCAIAEKLEKKGIVLKHFVIGFELDDVTQKMFDCVGTNYNVNDEATFRDVMNNIMSRILNKTTVEVDLLDQYKKPIVTNLNMSFYSSTHQVLRYDYYHTINELGSPDTLAIDPITDYDLTVHTLPPTTKRGIKLENNKHNIISVPVLQGGLQVLLQGKTIDNNLNNSIKCIVRSQKDSTIVYAQELNTTVQYLAGSYLLELLTLPRTYINTTLKADKTNTVQIPTPGIANLVKKYEVYGGIFVMRNNQLEKIYGLNMDDGAGKSETVALQPGSYFAIYRSKNSKSMHTSQTLPFEIRSGESLALNLDIK